ncbi:DUF4834 family protein [Desertivirga brevis]|uniref:DUF4834 family protein n=1 Tax=Desertivirga brevis TaxID=2810310 RepID=UPI001A96B9DC|nr:DUF4834 family protein [Pedobacter sp. SYSU D00873]
MAVIKFLFISILVMWLIKQIIKLLLPILFQKVVNKAQENVQSQYHRQQNYQQQKPIGKISVDYVPPKDKEARAADKAGDFIDFEEIK